MLGLAAGALAAEGGGDGALDVAAGCAEADDPDDTPCADATPVKIANAAAPASQCLAISFAPCENPSDRGLWVRREQRDRVGKYAATPSRLSRAEARGQGASQIGTPMTRNRLVKASPLVVQTQRFGPTLLEV
jgi:hypothetical protein